MSGNWERTGKTRVSAVTRWFRRPLVGLQVEYVDASYYNNGNRPTMWETASLEALTTKTGIDPRKGPSTIRYRAHKKRWLFIFYEQWLVMQVCDDPENNVWRDARVEDLGDIGGIKA